MCARCTCASCRGGACRCGRFLRPLRQRMAAQLGFELAGGHGACWACAMGRGHSSNGARASALAKTADAARALPRGASEEIAVGLRLKPTAHGRADRGAARRCRAQPTPPQFRRGWLLPKTNSEHECRAASPAAAPPSVQVRHLPTPGSPSLTPPPNPLHSQAVPKRRTTYSIKRIRQNAQVRHPRTRNGHSLVLKENPPGALTRKGPSRSATPPKNEIPHYRRRPRWPALERKRADTRPPLKEIPCWAWLKIKYTDTTPYFEEIFRQLQVGPHPFPKTAHRQLPCKIPPPPPPPARTQAQTVPGSRAVTHPHVFGPTLRPRPCPADSDAGTEAEEPPVHLPRV